MKKLFAFAALAIFALTSCGPRIYKAPELDTKIETHRTVAILPASVTVNLRPNQLRNTSRQELQDMSEKTSYDIQDKMYSWLLRRKDRFDYGVIFQDISTTNSRLHELGIEYEDMKTIDRVKIAKDLGVDAVIDSRFIMEKPMSDGAAIALGLIAGFWGATNQVQSTLNIYDASSGILLWKYDAQISGSAGSSPTQLVDYMMRRVARRLPYRR